MNCKDLDLFFRQNTATTKMLSNYTRSLSLSLFFLSFSLSLSQNIFLSPMYKNLINVISTVSVAELLPLTGFRRQVGKQYLAQVLVEPIRTICILTRESHLSLEVDVEKVEHNFLRILFFSLTLPAGHCDELDPRGSAARASRTRRASRDQS